MSDTSEILGSFGLLGIGRAQQVSAGKIRNIESKVEAKQIETAAAAREADRKESLARAVASQAAATGAAGITFQGSPLTILEEDIRREEVAGEREALQARLGVLAARTRGRVAESQARGRAIVGLLTDAASLGIQAAGGIPTGGGGGGGTVQSGATRPIGVNPRGGLGGTR